MQSVYYNYTYTPDPAAAFCRSRERFLRIHWVFPRIPRTRILAAPAAVAAYCGSSRGGGSARGHRGFTYRY